jgi:hypothetical protein
MKDQYDKDVGYCRMLGHYVPFRYCRLLNNGLPCRRIADCWHERMDVAEFITLNYTESERQAIFSPSPEKISTLVELIRRATDKPRPE